MTQVEFNTITELLKLTVGKSCMLELSNGLYVFVSKSEIKKLAAIYPDLGRTFNGHVSTSERIAAITVY